MIISQHQAMPKTTPSRVNPAGRPAHQPDEPPCFPWTIERAEPAMTERRRGEPVWSNRPERSPVERSSVPFLCAAWTIA